MYKFAHVEFSWEEKRIPCEAAKFCHSISRDYFEIRENNCFVDVV